MFSNRIRIIIIIVSAFFAVYELYNGRYILAALLFGTSLCIAGAYFRGGPVWIAFRSLKRGNSKRAEELIKSVRNPHLLASQQRAYYEMILGTIEAEKERYQNAAVHFRSALDHNLRTSNDRAVVESSLAEMLIETGDFSQASTLLESAGNRSHKPALDKMISELNERIKNRPEPGFSSRQQ